MSNSHQPDPTPGTSPSLPDAPTLAEGTGVVGPLREGPGTRIGPYKLLQVIGEGGFGTVFMAEQEKPVARRVALKIIKLGMDTRQVVARFEQERQALAMMDHPNIARVLDAGATETGRPFFVMELVKGDPITLYCDRNSLSLQERLELIAQVCQAVQHAHQKGIIHRDIKPSNILVSTQDGRAYAKVIDFGIAKATASKLTEKTLFTEHHQFVGTPEYMSPEQADGGLDVDTRTDVYSLGVLLYELLTGSTPFQGTDLRSAAYGEVQRIIREVDPPRPSTRISQSAEALPAVAAHRKVEPRRLGTLVRGELDWIVMKALEKDRARRYETANGLAADIRRYLAGEPVVAAPPSSVYVFKKFARRHKGVAIAAGLVGAALTLGVIGFAWQASIAGRQRDLAIAAQIAENKQRRAADEQRDRAVAAEAESQKRAAELAKVSEFQGQMLSQINAAEAGEQLMADIRTKFAAALEKAGVPEAERTTRAEAFGRELGNVNATDTSLEMIDRTILKPAIKAIDTQFKDQPLVDASLRHTVADLYRELGLRDEALPLQEQAVAIRRRELGDEHPDTLRSVNNLGSLLENQGKTAEAEKIYADIYEKRRRLLGPDHPDTLTSMGNLGNLYRSQAKFAEAEPLLRATLEGNRRVRGEDSRETLTALNTMGFLYVSQGKLAETEPYWREAYERGRKVLKEDDPDVFVWINNLAGLLQAQGKMDEAEPLFRESLERNRRVHGENHPNTIRAISVMGSYLYRRGRLDEAEAMFREALEKSTRTLGPENPGTLQDMNELGTFLMRRGQLAEAEPYLRQGYETRVRTQGKDHPETLIAGGQVGELLLNQNRLAEAEAMYRAMLESTRRVLGPEHPDTLVLYGKLANLLIAESKLDEAEGLINQALEIRRRISGEEHVDTLVLLTNNARLLEKRGKLVEAEAVYRDAMEKFRRTQGPDHPNTLNAYVNLAYVLRPNGKLDEAEALFREGLAGYVKKLGKDNTRTGSATLGLGQVLTDQKKFPEAETQLLEAQRVNSTAPGVSPVRRKSSIEALAALYAAWDKAEPGKGFDAKAAEWKSKVPADPAPPTDAKKP